MAIKRLACLGLVLLIGCGGNPPPNPEPEPPKTKYDEMLLSVTGNSYTKPDGTVVEVKGAESCCYTENGEPNPGWPTATQEWLDFTKSKGVNFLHFRPGAWRVQSTDTENALRNIGGGYFELETLQDKVDLSMWNPRFWAYEVEMIDKAGAQGQWVDVVAVDTWGDKWCQNGGHPSEPRPWTYHPWGPDVNIQKEDWCATSARKPVVPNSVHDHWIRKVVREFGRFGNVRWLDCNECDQINGYDPQWSISVAQIIRDEEAKNGYKQHLIGTNGNAAIVIDNPLFAFSSWHNWGGAPITDRTKCRGKPCEMAEYNPEPAMSGTTLFANYCSAKTAGTGYWAWRHGMSRANWNQALDLINTGNCEGSCAPPEDWQNWLAGGKPDPLMLGEATRALEASKSLRPDIWTPSGCMVKGNGAEFYQEALQDIAFRAQAEGVCAFWSDDAVMYLRPDGQYEQQNHIHWGSGCARIPHQSYIGVWRDPSPVAYKCPVPPPHTGYNLGVNIGQRGDQVQVKDLTPWIQGAGGPIPPVGWTGVCGDGQGHGNKCMLSPEKDHENGLNCARELCGETVEFTISGDGIINWVRGYAAKVTVNSAAVLKGCCTVENVCAEVLLGHQPEPSIN